MAEHEPRRLFTDGHKRKFLVIVDESPEGEAALYYAARRAEHTFGRLSLLFVIQPASMSHWLGVEQAFREEQHNKARAVFRLRGRKLKTWGFDIVPEEIVREGPLADEIVKLIEEDREIGILVLGASATRPDLGRCFRCLAAGAKAGTFQIPMTIVPGNLTI